MDIPLVRACVQDAEALWKMQVVCFADLLNRYQDVETNAASEDVESVR